MRLLSKILLAVFVLFSPQLKSQITVDSLAINEYVQDVLLGSGIQATNISFTGCLTQIGYLQEGNTINLGLNSGVMLSSGHVQSIPPADPTYFGLGDCTGQTGEADLLNIANSVPGLIGQNFTVNSINDKSILEFDFVPTGDTLRFRYIFGSYEYQQYENSQYNDIFAFFLSGPGISGPYDAPAGFPDGATNIAFIPGSDPQIPITISSVNATLNSEYYVNIDDQSEINVRGYTTVLEAFAEVVCGETYHIKLAIADGSDGGLDSFVLLEEGSFSSNAVVDVNLALNVGGPDAETLWEDCGTAALTFTRAEVSNLAIEDMVVIDWSGTADMGIDFTEMPDTLVFAPGVSQIVLDIDAFIDNNTEGLETVIMNILNLGACNGSGLVSNFQFFIGDHPDPIEIEPFATSICLGDSITLEPVITGGYGNFVYDWSNGESSSTIFVGPQVTTSYFLTVSDTCGLAPGNGTFDIEILVFPPLSVEITNGDLLLECNQSVDIFANATGGDGNYTYTWLDENGNNLFGWGNTLFYGSWNGEGQVIAQITDGCGFVEQDMINVELNVPDLIVTAPATFAAPCNVMTSLNINATGGQAPYNYSWELNGVFDWSQFGNSFNLQVNEPGEVTAYVSDGCGQNEVIVIPITIDAPPVSFDLVDDLTGTCATIFTATPTNLVGSGGYTYIWTNNGATIDNDDTFSTTFTTDTSVQLTVTDACSSSASDVIQIDIENPTIQLDLGADIQASCVDNNSIVPTISGGSGTMQYTWTVADTLYSSTSQIQVQSFATIPVQLELEDDCGETASDIMYIEIPDVPITFITSPDTLICFGGDVLLAAEAFGGEGGFTYDWLQSGSDSTSMVQTDVTQSGVFSMIATDICGRSNIADINVTIVPVEAIFTRDEIDTDEYEFYAASLPNDGITSSIWSIDGDTVSYDNILTYQFDGLGDHLVGLTAINYIGCTDYTEQVVNSSAIVYIPTAFTPNGDGINDVFKVEVNSVQSYEIVIFNRWGDVVFQSTDPNQVWLGDFKGTQEYFDPNGVYNYRITVKGFKNDTIEKSGFIQMIR
jgi:gliding motility-associated-like protein